MPATSTIRRIRQLVTEIGLWETSLRIGRRLYRRVFPVTLPDHPFDLRYGVDTGGLITGDRLDSGHPRDRHITAYWAIAPSSFESALACWNETLANGPYSCRDYVFLDIGCGKGRGIMLASEVPFHRIAGVEINPTLVSIAQRNLAVWKKRPHACGDIEVLHADALAFDLPNAPVLLYVFNPFDATAIQVLLDRIQSATQTRTAPIDVLYVTPDHAKLFADVPNLQLLWNGAAPLTPEETVVDAFQTQSLEYRIYRLSPHRE
jgi:SAM-dependent methyltransferase